MLTEGQCDPRPVTMATDLPDGLTTRPLTASDAGAVTELMAACERHDMGEVLIELEDIVADWQRPSVNLATDTLGVFADGRLVAYADVYHARRAEVFVRPDFRGRGIGNALMRWTWSTALGQGGRLVGQTVPDSLSDAVALFQAAGYRPLWTSWILELPEGAQIAAAALPDGVQIRAFEPGRDEHAAYQVIEDAFNEWPDRDASSYADWAAGVVQRPGFEPWHLLVAVEDVGGIEEQVVGACFVIPSADTGWVQQLAVRRDRRGRGLARALLLRAFAEARARGAIRFELNTDSRTGALGLYERVGMRVKQSFVHYARDLAPEH